MTEALKQVDALGDLCRQMQDKHGELAGYLAMEWSKFEAGAFYAELLNFLNELENARKELEQVCVCVW